MRWTLRSVLQQQAGFTLIELILTIILVGIIAGMGSVLLRQGLNVYVSEDARANLTSDGRLAIERMARELRTARSRTTADLPGCCSATTLSFFDISGNQITYTISGGNITRNTVVLASANSATLNFSYFQQDGTTAAAAATQVWSIQIDLAMTRSNEQQSYRVRVHPRNFV